MHTPGPWTVQIDDGGGLVFIAPASDISQVVATVWSFGPDEPAEAEQYADANLIAAAPDMLAALHAAADLLGVLVRVMDGGRGFNANLVGVTKETRAVVDAAIAQASP